MIFPFQGKGHIDWHYEISQDEWINEDKKIYICVDFIWDTYKFSLVVKTAPHPYRRRNQLTEIEKQDYVNVREEIKNELRKNKLVSWKVTNYYLQIAHMPNLNEVPIGELKTKINQEIPIISNKINQVDEQ